MNGTFIEKGIICAEDFRDLSAERISDDLKSNPLEERYIRSLICYAARLSGRGNSYNDTVTGLMKHIESNYHQELTVESLAELAGLSSYHMLHLFRGSTGLSLHRYIIQTRIRKSIEQFMPDRNLLDIALSCGFYDQSHFIKHFKRHVGTTPRSYLNSINFFSE